VMVAKLQVSGSPRIALRDVTDLALRSVSRFHSVGITHDLE